MLRLDRARRVDIDRMERRNCRHEATAALRGAKAGMGAGFGEMIFLDEGGAQAEGANRCVAAYAAKVGFYLTDAASDTAGDVGAVHHDISPVVESISKSGLWFL